MSATAATAANTSHSLPVAPILRGSGGGAPDGRRCRTPRRGMGGGAWGGVGATSRVTIGSHVLPPLQDVPRQPSR